MYQSVLVDDSMPAKLASLDLAEKGRVPMVSPTGTSSDWELAATAEGATASH